MLQWGVEDVLTIQSGYIIIEFLKRPTNSKININIQNIKVVNWSKTRDVKNVANDQIPLMQSRDQKLKMYR